MSLKPDVWNGKKQWKSMEELVSATKEETEFNV